MNGNKATSIKLIRYIFLTINLIFISSLFGQNEANIWYFGDYAGVDFNSGSPVALTNSQMSQYAGEACISNGNGELLFYSDGSTVWNEAHQVMDNGSNLKGGSWSVQAATVIKKPGEDSIYYIIHIADLQTDNYDTAFYSIVDMSYNGGLGKVISKNNYLYSPSLDKITAVNHENGEDVWLVLHERYSNAFCSFLFTSSGINFTPVVSYEGSVIEMYSWGYMNLSSSGARIAMPVYDDIVWDHRIEIFDFDNSTGVVSNLIIVNQLSCYDIEFSSDESLLYTSATGGFYQFDLSSGIGETIQNSMIQLNDVTSTYAPGAIQMGPDGKIYCCGLFSSYLNVINNPNNIGLSCDFVWEAVYLDGRMAYRGLPNFNQSYFSANINFQNQCLNDTTYIQLSNYSTVQSIIWDFGDPASGADNTSTELYPTHVFTAPGTYAVTANITLTDGTSEVSSTDITIYDFPAVNLGNDTTICDADILVLDAGSGFIDYLWSTGETTQTINVNSTGIYDVIASTVHCSSYDTININAVSGPFADAGSDEVICQFEQFDFNNSNLAPWATNYINLEWIGGVGVFSDPTILHPNYTPGINELGDVSLSLIAYNIIACSNDTSSMILTINEVPTADFTILPSASICLGESIFFDDNSTTTITNWYWDLGDGNTSNSQNVSHLYSSPGNYIVSLIVENANACNDTVSKTITVNSLPIVNYNYVPNDSICVNEQISFTDNSTINIQSWEWNYDDGNTSTIQNPNHSYVTAGNYNVQLIVTDNNTCVDSLAIGLQVNQLPIPDFNVLPNDTVCALQTMTLDGFDNAGTTITDWDWDFGDGNHGIGQIVNHIYTSPGDYTITLSAINNNSCSEVNTKTVHIQSLPESNFTISPNDTSCVGEIIDLNATNITSDIVNWNWVFGDGNTATGQNVNHTYTSPVTQTYNILSIYINANGCIDTTIKTRYVQDVDIDFSMIESPSCQDFNVVFNSTSDKVTFTPYNWTFGDGSVAVGIDTDHTYTTPDTLDVLLDVCSKQATHQLIINAACQVNAGSDEATCQDVYFDLSESATPPTADDFTSIQWYTNGLGTFDDATLLAPTYFPHPSEGIVQNDTLTMMMIGEGIDPCLDDTSYMQLVVIPGAYAQAGSDEDICFAVPYDFANSTDSAFATNYATINWSTSGTGSFVDPTAMQPVYIPGPNEIGPVTLTMVAANIINCDSIDDMVLTIRPTYEIPVDINVCYYDSIYAQGAWQYSSGIFYDTLPTVNYGCDSVIVTYFTVRPKIDNSFSLSTGDSICFGETTDFIPSGTANIITQFWDFGDGNTSLSANPSHEYTDFGDYTVVYYYTDDNSCSDSSVRQVSVFELPNVDFTVSMTNACVNTQVSFIGTSNFDIAFWDWDFGDGQSGVGQTTSHVYDTWGNMTIILTVTDVQGCSESSMQMLTIAQPPIADFTYESVICDSILFTNTSTSAPGYNIVQGIWNYGDGSPLDTTDYLEPTYHQYSSSTTPGGITYNVTLLVVADSVGFICTDSIVLPVIVPPLPDIFYTFSPDPT
ncbi:MAG: PKD domain-containing protein, partial [Bacteroidota bacterium]